MNLPTSLIQPLLRQPASFRIPSKIVGTAAGFAIALAAALMVAQFSWFASPWVPGPAVAGTCALVVPAWLGCHSRANRLGSDAVGKSLSDEERQARAVLEKDSLFIGDANRAKMEFLAHMSHEIRTPLHAIMGFAQILGRDRALSEGHRHSVAIIERSSIHLLKLINELLELSRAEAGHVGLVQKDFDLRELLLEISSVFEPRCLERSLEWRIEYSVAGRDGQTTSDALGLGPIPVRGDEGKLRQVLMILLGNAVKFTEAGKVTLRVTNSCSSQVAPLHAGQCPPSNSVFAFEVEDTGPGIPKHLQAKIFEPFTQAEEGRRKGGTGLGLAIGASNAKLMGGALTLASSPGRGARFALFLPLESASPDFASACAERLRNEKGTEAVIADDVTENREILNPLLTEAGSSSTKSERGERANPVLSAQHSPRLIDPWENWFPFASSHATVARYASSSGSFANCDTGSCCVADWPSRTPASSAQPHSQAVG